MPLYPHDVHDFYRSGRAERAFAHHPRVYFVKQDKTEIAAAVEVHGDSGLVHIEYGDGRVVLTHISQVIIDITPSK